MFVKIFTKMEILVSQKLLPPPHSTQTTIFSTKKREKAASFYIFLLLEQPLTSCYQITVMEAEFGQMYPYLSIYID